MNITSNSASVQWVIPYLAYTPEQYNINYGTARDSLDQSSPILASSTNISASNMTYSISIQELTPNRVYYFQLRSMNTYGVTTSAIMTLRTLESGIAKLF